MKNVPNLFTGLPMRVAYLESQWCVSPLWQIVSIDYLTTFNLTMIHFLSQLETRKLKCEPYCSLILLSIFIKSLNLYLTQFQFASTISFVPDLNILYYIKYYCGMCIFESYLIVFLVKMIQIKVYQVYRKRPKIRDAWTSAPVIGSFCYDSISSCPQGSV